MTTPVSVINLGLGKFGSSVISSIAPPRTVIERVCSTGYEQWVRSELQKRRWRFALSHNYPPALSATLDPTPPDGRSYVYDIPPNSLRVIRTASSEWIISGKKLYSGYATGLYVDMIVREAEDDFDPAFVDVLSWRCAMELVEPVTQSNEKWQKCQTGYKDALRDAARINAFHLEQDDTETPDEQDSWIAARKGFPPS